MSASKATDGINMIVTTETLLLASVQQTKNDTHDKRINTPTNKTK